MNEHEPTMDLPHTKLEAVLENQEKKQAFEEIINQALIEGSKITVEKLKGEEVACRENDISLEWINSGYNESNQIIYTDGQKEINNWERHRDDNVGYDDSRIIKLTGATVVIERKEVENKKYSGGKKGCHKFKSYYIRARNPEAIREMLKHKELPELSKTSEIESSILLSNKKFKTLAYELKLSKECRDKIKKEARGEIGYIVKTLNASTVQMTEIDETAGSGSSPYYYQNKIIFTDGNLKYGEWETEESNGSNPDGGIDKRRTTIANATIIIVKKRLDDSERENWTTFTFYISDQKILKKVAAITKTTDKFSK